MSATYDAAVRDLNDAARERNGPSDSLVRSAGGRQCRECANAAARERYARLRGAA